MGLVRMTDEEYFSHPAWSRSTLHAALRSPAHCLEKLQRDPTVSPSMRKGSLVHCMLLEPGEVKNRYQIVDGNRNSNAIKVAIEEAAKAGITVLRSDEYREAEAIYDSIHAHPKARALVAEGIVEHSAFFRDEESGLELKAKPDLIRASDGIILDIKTTVDARQHTFRNSALDYGYHMQAALYLDAVNANGLSVSHFAILAVENVAPYAVVVYIPDAEFVQFGRAEYRRAAKIVAHCLAENKWSGYSEGFEELKLPNWKRRELGYE